MPRQGPHPVRFFILMLPFGASFGLVSFALPVLAVRAGISDATMGSVIAAAYLVHSFKPLWAPLVDTTLDRKTWYLIALALTAIGSFAAAAMPLSPGRVGILRLVVMASQVGLTFMNFAVESFLALAVPRDEKASASGWYQAAQFAGVGLGGWFALKLAGWLPGWQVGLIYAVIMLPCALALIGLHVPRGHAEKLSLALRQLVSDIWSIIKSPAGWTGLLIAAVPVGVGAVQNQFQATAPRWGIHVGYELHTLGMTLGADDVLGALNGALGAVLSAAGAFAGGWLVGRMRRRLAYAWAGMAIALAGLGMALAPREPWAFIVFAGLYNFFTGVAYACFTGFVLEIIGGGAAATKYNIFAAFLNLAISYTLAADAFALARGGASWGTTYMLLTDVALSFAGIILILVVAAALRSREA